MLRASEIRQKEVINITDGRRMGFAGDVEINYYDGTAEALVIPSSGKMFGLLGRNDDIIIPWQKIRIIGEDVILVDLDERFIRRYIGY